MGAFADYASMAPCRDGVDLLQSGLVGERAVSRTDKTCQGGFAVYYSVSLVRGRDMPAGRAIAGEQLGFR